MPAGGGRRGAARAAAVLVVGVVAGTGVAAHALTLTTTPAAPPILQAAGAPAVGTPGAADGSRQTLPSPTTDGRTHPTLPALTGDSLGSAPEPATSGPTSPVESPQDSPTGPPSDSPAGSPSQTASSPPTSTANPSNPTPPGPPVAPGSRALYLSFDDGPDPAWTPPILAVLARHQAHATFFQIGVHAAAYPGLVRAVRGAGMTIGDHTMHHARLTTLSPEQIRVEIEDAAAAIGGSVRCVRPPYGAVDDAVRAVVKAGGRSLAMWNDDPRDWSRPGVDAIVATAEAQARSGGTMLMHDGGGDRSETVAALDRVLTDLAARGFRFEAVPGC